MAARFQDAERRIRALVAQAPDGDRRVLLTSALALLAGLRAEQPGLHVETAYLAAARGARRARGRAPDLPDPSAVRDLAGSLAFKLDRAVRNAQERSRTAFRTVTADTVDESATAAVTAHTARAGTRWPLGGYADMVSTTIGRHATTRAVFDTVDADGTVTISGGQCPICVPRQGVFPAGGAPRPPFHPHCDCVASVG